MVSELGDAGTGHNWHAEPAHRHLVQFYESDSYLLDALTKFVVHTLANQEACIVVATSAHFDDLHGRLATDGIDIESASRRGQFVALEIGSTMDRFMAHDVPDPKRFEEVFGPVVRATSNQWGSTRVFGEMVSLIVESNNPGAALKLEQIWNDLLARYEFTLCCAYPMRAFSQPNAEPLMIGICEQHSAVFPAESYPYWADTEERNRAITLLQQKAARLTVEVDHRRQIEDRLRVALNAERAARQEAESALHVRDEFVSIAAHELKTPLTSLIGRAQFLLRASQGPAPQENSRARATLESIVGQANKLSRLINQLLDVTRLKGGKLAIERRPIDIVALVMESFDSIRPDIEMYDIELESPASLMVAADPIRMEQVAVNLMNNAVKYSPEGSRIHVAISQRGRDRIRISVRDFGPGITPAQRAHIFERFYQADRADPRHGLGLGLYISREIVELHGGSIHAEFPDDGGTRMTVEIPVSLPTDEARLH